eukprot:TRINITY_DN403_c0_g1_i1.p1 TRINITY_DN403_c0_g1~~TRINITY_DN403_c0_g1_i1.p1  ORF type:complete len:174 (-),score=60.39 TRINITY_DN403_c0_g1_i1:75-596(-)
MAEIVSFEIKRTELAFPEFTDEEKKEFRECFKKYDTDKNHLLQVFELHRLYEEQGQTKTNAQLLELISEANPGINNATSIDYQGFLTILLKDRKGQLKTSFGLLGLVGKVHDDKKEVGKKANVFEQLAAKEKEEELRKKHEQDVKEAKKKEAERKKQVKEKLSKFKAGINAKK